MAGYFNEGVLVQWDEDREPALIDRYKVWILDPKQTVSLMPMTICLSPHARALIAI